MNGPQWNDFTFQPPLTTDPSIHTRNMSLPHSPILHAPYNTTHLPAPPQSQPHQQHHHRETGIIEKILTSYGFIRCNQRKARIFFHFSEYNGDVTSILVGDLVEFHIENHAKTGKPLACNIVRLEPICQPLEILSEEKFHGSLVKEAKCVINGSVTSASDGMLTYQNCGESFFVPYGIEDVCGDPHMKLNPGDQLLFYVATDIMGNLRARQVELLLPMQPRMQMQSTVIQRAPVAIVQPQFAAHTQPLIHQPPPPLMSKAPLLPTPSTDSLTSSSDNSQNALNSQPHNIPILPLTTSHLLTNPPVTQGGAQGDSLIDPTLYQGVICSLKEKFGFIERSDVVKEIFFRFTEYQGKESDLKLGSDVQFDIQIRNNKELAVNLKLLPAGTVIFEDVSGTRHTGTVSKTLKTDRSRRNSDLLNGRIVYDTVTGQKELPFGDKDQISDCTLMEGDVVKFSIATDRRDQLERASEIELLPESVDLSKERQTGTVASLKDGYGFVQCSTSDSSLFFHFSEVIHPDWRPRIGDKVNYDAVTDPSVPSRQMAIRVCRASSVAATPTESYTVLPEKYIGTINIQAGATKNHKMKPVEGGKIIFDYKSAIRSIIYHTKDLLDCNSAPRVGDKIEFQIAELVSTSAWKAVNIKLMIRTSVSRSQGFIATLKDNFGFIELADHEKEVFFHFSAYEGDPNDLDLGDELDFSISRKNNKVSAENIRRLPKGSITTEEIKDKTVLSGVIVRPMRMVNPDQEDYAGLVQAVDIDNEPIGEQYPYGITSLADNRDFLQENDSVKFQVAVVKATGKQRAVNVAAKRSYIRAKVDSVKGQYGFLDYEPDGAKKLFFHMTEVHDNADVNTGDEVEFVVVKNQRNGKYSACSLRKISNTQRPDRLLTRLKSIHEAKPTYCVIRQPRGPDGTTGFSRPRKAWAPILADGIAS